MNIQSPKAKKIAKKLVKYNDERIDNYYWLNDSENPEVLAYLNAENEYYDKITADFKPLQEDLFKEMKSRIKEDDESVPYKKNQYLYITKFKTGQQYPIFTRKKDSLNAVEEIMFDVNKMAEKHAYYNLSGISVSPNNKMAAFGVDTVSRRQYTLHFKNLETGEILEEEIINTTGSATWANDNKTIFYTQKNSTTLRGEKIFKHILGTKPSEDIEIYFEEEEAFNTYVYKTKSEKYLVIGSYSTVSSEYRILEADNPNGEFKVFQARKRDLEYSIAHFNEHFYILTNKDDAINFKLMRTSEKTTNKEHWEEVMKHRKDVLLEDISIFKDFLVVEERSNGLNKIRIIKWDKSEDFYLPFEEETYSAGVYFNPEYDTNVIRYGYNSMTTPNSVIDFNVDDKTKIIKKEQQVLGGDFDKNNYKSERIWATAKDGVKIPISLVYHKNTNLSENTPLLLYGYGSYGYTIDAGFSSTRLSLLNRGFVFAIAHVRGSEYLGRNWYETGKLLHKKNTFTDFIACGEHLISKKYTSEKHLYASGGSAGGLLMGAIINMEPNLFNGIVANVPFVDVLTTMLDDSIPLTTGEYDEWGNPNDKKYYNYIKSYSPIDNVTAQNYPNMLVTTGLHDSQVQYFEPAKWVAKLRELKTDKNILIMHTNMEAGHGGASGRFNALKETARDYGFILGLEGYTSFKKNY
ncbi:S9 family peptidase [Lutibacter sp.]|uniref:S9 family peptidase n=1 Tax=Lutibacter sp. TaxID=1925666 RepID=UPI0025BC522A|nr:S9 family peptidase [Lutibacter sp.]MCF6181879.1 S9 family peptidase [Lutibacter sp.]